MTRLHLLLSVGALVGAGLFAACSKSNPEPEKSDRGSAPTPVASAVTPTSPSGAAPSTAAAANPSGASAGELAWDAPAAWPVQPNSSSMRLATYKVPKVAGDTDDAELTVSAAGGGVEPNIKRWAGQFGNAEPKTTPRTVNGLKVTIVEIKGSFASGGMMGAPSPPKSGMMLLGAVVDGGERQHFFKMTGPEKTVTAARKDFDAFVGTFRAKPSK